MRALLFASLLLAACSGEGEKGNGSAPAPAPRPTGPAPRTPVTSVSPAPGKSPNWLRPRDGTDDPQSAPYANVLDQPVVKGAGR